MSYYFCRKNSDGTYTIVDWGLRSYLYVEDSNDTLTMRFTEILRGQINITKPIIWVQEGRYGWISKEQVQNMMRRQIDSGKQQKGYAKDKPIDLAFHWDDTTPLDPATVKLIRETSP